MKWESKNDKELWIMPLGENVIPFYCQLGVDTETGIPYWTVRTATFLGSVYRQVSSTLGSMAVAVDADLWILAASVFEVHFNKCPGITPEFYVRILNREGGKTTTYEIDSKLMSDDILRGVNTDFAAWVHEKTGMLTRQELSLIWISMCQEMPRYLLTTNTFIDLGWARIFGLPYRANWKQILLTKFPRIWKWLKGRTEWHKLEISPFSVESNSADLIGAKAHGGKAWLISWTPELQPMKAWYDYTHSVEQHAYASLTPRAYLDRIGTLFEANWKNLVSVFRSYVSDTTLPCGDIADPHNPTARRFVAWTPEGSPTPVPCPNPPAAWVSDPCDNGVYPASQRLPRKGEAGYVSEVPIVSLYAEDRPDGGILRPRRGTQHKT